jgi:hypothetical protein
MVKQPVVTIAATDVIIMPHIAQNNLAIRLCCVAAAAAAPEPVSMVILHALYDVCYHNLI